MAKSRKEIADRARAESLSYSEKVSDFKTPYNLQGVIGDINTNTFTEGALNSSRKELNEKQLAYFHEFSRYNFKHGLEVRPGENGDEDPVVFGFDIIINTQTSPLFGSNGEASISEFFTFGDTKGIREISNRRELYDKFNNQFSKFFSRTDSSFRNVKSFYLKSIEGLEGLINQATAIHDTKKQFVQYGKDSESIKLTMYEDNYLNAGYMAMLYNTMAYSKINGKQIIPENLLRFDMSIVVSEIRKFNKVLNSLENGNDVINVVNDNISRYKYNLYDCQFNFDKMTHPDSVKNFETSVKDEYTFNIYYKFVTLEMEKFELNIGEADTRSYINNGNVEVNQRQNGDASSAPGLTDLPYRTNRTDYIRFDQNGQVGNNVNTFLKPSPENNIDDDGSGNTIPEEQKNSEIDNLKEQEAKRNSGTRDNLSVEDEERLKSQNGSIPLEPLYSGEFLPNYREAYPKGYNILEGAQVDEAVPKTGIAAIIDEAKEFTMNRARQVRNKLLNSTLQKIRTSTGLRRISSPINVYNDPSTLNFVEGGVATVTNQIKDFANTELTSFIQKSPLGNIPINDIKALNLEYNKRIHDGEGGGGISSYDNEDTIL